MHNETITVINTESGQSMNVVVLHKRANQITVVIGKGIHNVQCDLIPARNGHAYAGSMMRREIVYHRTREQVQVDLYHLDPRLKVSRKFKK